VRPSGGEVISYRKPRTTAGTLFKDFTSSKDLNNGWETVALSGGAVDLNRLTLAVNLYRGGGRNNSVELRIAVNGETWGRSFTIRGPADGGKGLLDTLRHLAPANPAWIVPDARKVVGKVQ
ncbi:MAG: hypothetical protein AAF441_17375, partial [Pseudomonadota bacterium]